MNHYKCPADCPTGLSDCPDCEHDKPWGCQHPDRLRITGFYDINQYINRLLSGYIPCPIGRGEKDNNVNCQNCYFAPEGVCIYEDMVRAEHTDIVGHVDL